MVDRGFQLRIVCIVMIILAIITILLRFWSRAISKSGHGWYKRRFWWDDWVALLTLPIIIISLSLTIRAVALGLGKHVEELDLPNTIQKLKIALAIEVTYNLSITLPKISALLFYTRVFSISSRMFHYCLWFMYFCVVAWFIALSLFSIFSCNPVSKQWNPTIPGHCHDRGALNLGSVIPSVVIDFMILLVPLPLIWKLQISKPRKALVTGVMICGYCVIVISLGRLIVAIKTTAQVDANPNYAEVFVLYWSSTEATFSLLTISLPSIFILVRRGFREGITSLFTSRNTSTKAHLKANNFVQPSIDYVPQNNSRPFGNDSHELERQSFGSGRNILPLVPEGQEYQVKASKASSKGSSNYPSDDQIQVRSEVRVNSENIV